MTESGPRAPPLGRWLPPTIVLVAFAVDLVLAGLHLLNAQGIGPAGRPLRFFEMDDEMNLPTWWASVQLFSIGLLIGVVAIRAGRRAPIIGGLAVWALSGVYFVLSLDEFVQLHERVGRATRADILPATGMWPLILGPLLIVVVAGALVAARPHLRDRRGLVLVCAGFALFLGAALGIELAVNLVTIGSSDHRMQVLAEELGELLGATVMLWGWLRMAWADPQCHHRIGCG